MAKILIVDDEKEFIDMLAVRLQRTGGYEILEAFDGEEGLRVAKETLPDLIILDLTMPKLSGAGVLKLLKENASTQTIPVLILTASVAPATVKEIAALGAAGFIAKPFETKDLMDKVAFALKRP